MGDSKDFCCDRGGFFDGDNIWWIIIIIIVILCLFPGIFDRKGCKCDHDPC